MPTLNEINTFLNGPFAGWALILSMIGSAVAFSYSLFADRRSRRTERKIQENEQMHQRELEQMQISSTQLSSINKQFADRQLIAIEDAWEWLLNISAMMDPLYYFYARFGPDRHYSREAMEYIGPFIPRYISLDLQNFNSYYDTLYGINGIEKHRLFLGERLWGLLTTYHSFSLQPHSEIVKYLFPIVVKYPEISEALTPPNRTDLYNRWAALSIDTRNEIFNALVDNQQPRVEVLSWLSNESLQLLEPVLTGAQMIEISKNSPIGHRPGLAANYIVSSFREEADSILTGRKSFFEAYKLARAVSELPGNLWHVEMEQRLLEWEFERVQITEIVNRQARQKYVNDS